MVDPPEIRAPVQDHSFNLPRASGRLTFVASFLLYTPMLRRLRWIALVIPLPFLLMAALRPNQPPPVVIPGAFHWRNSSYLSGQEHHAIQRNGLQRVYFKMLDIDWSPAHGAHPVSVVLPAYQWNSWHERRGEWTDRVGLVPCIYITNATFAKLDEKGVVDLAAKLLRKLRMITPRHIDGVLLDCDWTASTRARFFALTRQMNDSLEVPVSATIRLHQYADPKGTGIPPADRGMLMLYNVGQITTHGATNSIFDEGSAAPYFRHDVPYPLALDIALPAFSWGAHFRKGRFIGILRQEQLDDALRFGLLRGDTNGLMQVVLEDNERLPEVHLGDEIRMETMTPATIGQATELARRAINTDTVCVAFFETGASCFQELDTAFVRNTFARFGTLHASTWPVGTETGDFHPEAVDSIASFVPVDSTLPEIRQ